MVIILSKTLEKKKGVDDVRSKDAELLLRELHTMSRGTTLFSCGTVETDRWLDLGLGLGRGCTIQRGTPCQSAASLESLWDVLPECKRRSRAWGRETGTAATTAALSSLICELNLGDAKLGAAPQSLAPASSSAVVAAPPSKRQCRSLSLSDEFGGCRSPWRPQGSRVWTAVEKRRCHSGGSVQRCPGGGGGISGRHFPAMQRSSSFSLPCHSSHPADGPLELPCFTQRLPPHPLFLASPVSPVSPSHQHHSPLRPLSLSHEQISLPEPRAGGPPSEASSPDSTPELGRRAGNGAGLLGGLSRSRSQPCVLNDKKIAMKRRRPEDAQEQRPSLDLAKMTQKLRTFHSLSCPGISASPDGGQSSQPPLSLWNVGQSRSDFTCEPDLGVETQQVVDRDEEEEEEEEEEDSSFEELDSDSACSAYSRPGSPGELGEEREGDRRPLWKGDRGMGKDIHQLGGELDIDQIERN